MAYSSGDFWKKAAQTKGLDGLCASMERARASSSPAMDLTTPRRILPRLIVQKNPSAALSREADPGVKRKVDRG